MTKITLPPGVLDGTDDKRRADPVDIRSTKEQRRPAPNVIDQRQQQIDPAGKHRVDDDMRDGRSTKQPGRSR